jgi:hypothetical protein
VFETDFDSQHPHTNDQHPHTNDNIPTPTINIPHQRGDTTSNRTRVVTQLCFLLVLITARGSNIHVPHAMTLPPPCDQAPVPEWVWENNKNKQFLRSIDLKGTSVVAP